MKIGYPCINRSIGCTANSTFRLANYSDDRCEETVAANLVCSQQILDYNLAHGIGFFRLSSDIVPFASHPVNTFDWTGHFKKELQALGRFIQKNKIRVAMHPDQFVILNALSPQIVEKSIAELRYHADFLDALGVDAKAKIQIHVGGAYGDKESAIRRFVEVYDSLPEPIHRRLVIENDERLFCLADCLDIHSQVGVPIVLDMFHHAIFNHGEEVDTAMRLAGATWKKSDGLPIVDYSSQASGSRTGAHTESIDIRDFGVFINNTRAFDFDIMLEIKDKETSVLKALAMLAADKRVT
jgi:UV DNA damage endonuclease